MTQKLHFWMFITGKCLSKKLCMNVYGCFIHNVPKLEAVQMSFSRYMIEQNVKHPYKKYI